MVGILLEGKIGPKGQVVIPKPIRRLLHMEKDTTVVFSVEDDFVRVSKKKRDEELLRELFTAFPRMKLPKKIDWDKLYYSQFESR